MFRCYSYTTIRERINLCLLKLQLLKWSIKIHRCVVNMVVVWLHHTTTILTTHRYKDLQCAVECHVILTLL